MTARRKPGAVVALRPDAVLDHRSQARTTIATALDDLEEAACSGGVLYADVAVQLALARHLAAIVGAIHLGSEPSVAQVHAIRELRLAITELRELVTGYTRRVTQR